MGGVEGIPRRGAEGVLTVLANPTIATVFAGRVRQLRSTYL